MQPVVTEILSQNFFKHSSLNSQLFNTLLHDMEQFTFNLQTSPAHTQMGNES